MEPPKRIPCPKCGRSLAPAGEVDDGRTVKPVYQCDECLTVGELFGKPFELPLTFTLDENGNPVPAE